MWVRHLCAGGARCDVSLAIKGERARIFQPVYDSRTDQNLEREGFLNLAEEKLIAYGRATFKACFAIRLSIRSTLSMKFTLSWLKEHLETSATVAEIADTLTMIGLEVESVEMLGPALNDFIVAQVLTVEPHPQADRLKICQVDTGSGIIQVVCGAPNTHAGMKGLLARPGVIIPASGERLKKGVIRGVESQGMLCSARELKLGEDHAGVIALPAAAPVGAKALEVLAFDSVFDLAITPNRADCLGVQGIARDLAAAGLGTFRPPVIAPIPGTFQSPLTVARSVEVEAACPLFVGRFIRGVRNGPSPDWLQQRLTAVGLRPISALVDITNLLSLEAARPLHVFDADRLSGGSLTVRLAREGETLAALNGKTYPLQGDMIVIVDAKGPQALAGLVGGQASACSESTVNVFVESALFDPVRIARAGRMLAIESEARYRFERGVDPASAVAGAERATRLILDLCGGKASTLVVTGAEPAWQRTFVLRMERFSRLSGFDLPIAVMQRQLEAIGCTVQVAEEGVLTIVPPSWRRDLEGEHDLVEEIIRLHGYDRVPVVSLPRASIPSGVVSPGQQRRSWVRRALAARGLLETTTWSFMSSLHAALFTGGAPVHRLANPISTDLDALRPSLLPNLIMAVSRNAARDLSDSALFEIGLQFHGDTPGAQKWMATGVRAGHNCSRHWARPQRPVDVFDAKADALAVLETAGAPTTGLQVSADAPAWYHPGRSGTLRLGITVLGWFGEIHPRVSRALDVKGALAGFEIFLEAIPQLKVLRTRPLLKTPPFHPVVRDFAFVVDSTVAAETVLKAARSVDKTLIVAVEVFDVYEGLGMGDKSLAIAVALQPTERTLTDQDIEVVSSRIIDAVARATGATLRT
ncbi:MAG: phenylalanyl-tRNA synthetase beta chain [Rhodospirillaceae bacterium]|nr:MAG: phenylalanyl-tRNA synthetase beta chain [Rhodospirillaceae bacterium]